MILLPMEKEVANALQFPRHRQTALQPSHKAYSDNVESRLKDIFDKLVKKQLRKHEVPKYNDCKTALEALSKELYDSIVQAGGRGTGSLDEMPEEDFRP